MAAASQRTTIHLPQIPVTGIYDRYSIRIEPGAYCDFSRKPTNGAHSHDFYELTLVVSGCGEYKHGAQTYPLSAGDVFSADPCVVHEISSRKTKDLRIAFVKLLITTNAAADAEDAEDRLIDGFVKNHAVVAMDERFLHYPPLFEAAKHNTFLYKGILRMFVFAMVNALAPLTDTSVKPYDDIIAKACAYIGRRLSKRLTVGEIASRFNIPERTLLRLFRMKLGKSVIDEIARQKINRAIHHLLFGLSVYETGARVGIDDPGQFSRFFKQHVGISPKEYQQKKPRQRDDCRDRISFVPCETEEQPRRSIADFNPRFRASVNPVENLHYRNALVVRGERGTFVDDALHEFYLP